MLNRKSTKLLIAWSSKVAKSYIRNIIIWDLHRSNRISMYLADEVKYMKTKFLQAYYPGCFVDSVRNFRFTMDVEESLIIPSSLFDEEKPFTSIDIPFCENNGSTFKNFIKNFYHFTKGSFI